MHRYELEDGQFREEEVIILNKGTDEEEIVVTGSYGFWGSDNQLYITKYKADRNGYAASTSHTRRESFEHKDTPVEVTTQPAQKTRRFQINY